MLQLASARSRGESTMLTKVGVNLVLGEERHESGKQSGTSARPLLSNASFRHLNAARWSTRHRGTSGLNEPTHMKVHIPVLQEQIRRAGCDPESESIRLDPAEGDLSRFSDDLA